MATDTQQHSRNGGVHTGHHFLIVAYGFQSHLNPCRVLAHRLAHLHGVHGSGPVLATVSLPVSAHRRMFPSSGDAGNDEDTATDGVVSYAPYSDGLDDGSMARDGEARARSRQATFESLSALLATFAARGRPVTCVVCSMVLPAALDVAREHAIPLAVYWIQPATVLAAYYHYFHGHGDLVTSHAADPAYEVSLPGLHRPLRIRDFPSFLVDTTGSELVKFFNESARELFEHLGDPGCTKVLVNTFDELEPAALAAMKEHLDVFAVGPVIGFSSTEAHIHLFNHAGADEKRYMEWLGAQAARSVVYVSFGSIWTYSKKQMEEIANGLRRCGRPYLLVVRNDGRQEDVSRSLDDVVLEGQGMVVEWCDQPKVLSHPSVGCFVTHCGWNSALEVMALGVPVVAAPSLLDQPTSAFLIEEEWAAGVRGERNSEGVLTGEELARCVELLMDYGQRAIEIRERVEALKWMAQEAAASGGPAERSLRSFVMAANSIIG
ncbi:cyanidin 3-O-rutinoside 5-O-glucosyltransferase-like [Triticum dicoccoides]|uniref:cyanidin 3-O-rutinoside 5-O-glucosyltransferase-like n=1 Tax=Triticum dicoccoides TaxID=85692 RepID=UPI000E7A4913|nr:cyanidin 3-O-rutinoside 5-O-glucosyltransferase-like [Triticum dicoccoides]